MHCNNCSWVVHMWGFTSSALLLGNVPVGWGLGGREMSVHTPDNSLKCISLSCASWPLLFPYHKHLSRFIWPNIWLKQMSWLCCLPWVLHLVCVWERGCVCTPPMLAELWHPLVYLNNYNQSYTAQMRNVWSSQLIINPEKKHPRSYFIE